MTVSPPRPDTDGWLKDLIGRAPHNRATFEQALTHGSAKPVNYERLEFLGDRILGLLIGEWVFDRFADEPEGKLSRRYNALVSGETCADMQTPVSIAVQPGLLQSGIQRLPNICFNPWPTQPKVCSAGVSFSKQFTTFIFQPYPAMTAAGINTGKQRSAFT